ncbi:hypothetical protein DL96DRAFT_1607140 [Flagelloscypha sp. PMI_526]|nr:hypothetical protein DL96DRAFT_1607140 [Flagelloscypha sp. PMI_526]
MAGAASLPVDIARLIVEMASRSLYTACSLSLVSKEVQTWSDPFLFCTVVISVTDIVSKEMELFMDSFTAPTPTQRLLRARGYVQIVATQQLTDPNKRIPRFLGCCSNLFSFCNWTQVLSSSFFDLHIMSLKWLSLNGWVEPLSFKSPVFQSITHLDLTGLNFSEWPDIWNANLGFIPSLTHLLLDASGPSDVISNDVLSIISSHLTPTIQLVLLSVKGVTKGSITSDHDKRIAIVEMGALNVYEEVWMTFSGPLQEGEAVWSHAEKLLKVQRRELEA